MPTIKDVAQLAGVSTATVSRVLYGNYPVHEDTRKKVLQSVNEVGYTPNAVARSLKVNKTNMIGVLVPTIANPYFMDFAKGIESKVACQDYHMIFGSTDEDQTNEIKLLNLLTEQRVDAIAVASRMTDATLINRLVSQGTNIVVIDSYLEDLQTDRVTENDFAAAYKLLTHLYQMGHSKIAIISGNDHASTARERLRAYEVLLKNYNLPFKEHYILKGEFDRKKAYNSVNLLFTNHADDLPTALFATNNESAEGAFIALKEKGLKVPSDMSLVSYGDFTIPGLMDLKLTHVRQNPYHMGEICGDIILNKINCNKKTTNRITLDLDIVLGDSVEKV